MKKCLSQLLVVLSIFFLNSAFALSELEVREFRNMDGGDIKSSLRSMMSKNHRSMSYGQAKDVMFGKVDNENGEVCCVYSDLFCIRTSKTPNHNQMNAEHTWPQSKGATGVAKSDLHHLFPTVSKINSARSNYPFCNVVTVKWEMNGSKVGRDSKGTTCFEPPEIHKGNVARAMFYFSIRYNKGIDADQEEVLRSWHRESPVDRAEEERHAGIVRHQQNENYFITNPELVDLVTNF